MQPLIPTDTCSLHASIHSIHWQTPHVQALTPSHFASVIINPNCGQAPLCPFTYILDHQICLAPRPMSIQSVDRPFMVGCLTLTTISSMARSSYACTSHKPSPGVSPEAPPPFQVLTRFSTTLVPLLWFQCKPQACPR